jgi:hypothetical protein
MEMVRLQIIDDAVDETGDLDLAQNMLVSFIQKA